MADTSKSKQQGSMTPAPSADEPTKAELLEQAKEADVEGRSSMTKEELAEALGSAGKGEAYPDDYKPKTPWS